MSASSSASVYDGLNGTGNLLGTIALSANYSLSCTGDPTGEWCHFDLAVIPFSGSGRSVVLTNVQDFCAIDNMSFTTAGPAIPTLSEWGLILLGISLLSFGTFYLLRTRS
jgi:hypothetical protein